MYCLGNICIRTCVQIKSILQVKLWKISYPVVKTFVLGAHKSHLIESVLLYYYARCHRHIFDYRSNSLVNAITRANI